MHIHAICNVFCVMHICKGLGDKGDRGCAGMGRGYCGWEGIGGRSGGMGAEGWRDDLHLG